MNISPRSDVSEEQRTKIIESVTQVFARQGFANTRMDDVANEAGLSKGLLYWNFRSKEQIIIRIADLLFGVEFRMMQNLSTEGKTAQACLEEFPYIFLNDLRGMVKIAPVIYGFYALAFRNATVRRVMQEYLQQFLTTLELVVHHGIDRGEFEHGNVRQVTVAIGSALKGTLLLWAYASEIVNPEDQMRISMALILKGLTARK